jgi:hypothetical protein
MKAKTILKKLQSIQSKADDIKIKLDEEMNELYFMVGDLFYKIEEPPKRKTKLKKKLK